GDVPLMSAVTGAATPEFPLEPVATACTWYAPGGSGPVIHVTVPPHVVPLHEIVPNTAPLPQSLIVASPALSLAVALTLMLLPVHEPLAGDVMLTVGGVASPVPVPPGPSLTTNASAEPGGVVWKAPADVVYGAPVPVT